MEIIFLFGTVQSFFISLLIFSKKNKSTGDYVLGSWIAFIGLHLLDSYFHESGLIFKYPHIIGIGHTFPILQGPFMFVYVLVMINKTGKFKPVYLIHGIPFFAAFLYMTFKYFFLSAPEKVAVLKTQMIHLSPDFVIIWYFKVFLGPVYVIWSLIKLQKHKKNIADNFSFSERINLNWLKYVVSGIGFVWITVLLTMFFRIYFPHMPLVIGNFIIYSTLTATVFFLGFFGFKQQVIYRVDPVKFEAPTELTSQKNIVVKAPKPKEQYKKSGLDKKTSKDYLNRLLKLMDKEKPYLNSKLSLKELADSIGISPNNLSQVINEQTNMCFFDFVNKYRVEEVKTRLADPKNRQFTLLAIAYDCGFNSKSSFNSIFKKTTGYTPSEYLKSFLS